MTTITQALVVDDSKSARYSMKKSLQRQGVESYFAESADDALAILERRTPDVIFMDHLMPGMDGIAATRAIKANPETRDIPVVMCSSRSGESYEHEARRNGAVAVLPKPTPEYELSEVLELLSHSHGSARRTCPAPEVSQKPQPNPQSQPQPQSAITDLQIQEIINHCRAQLLKGLQSSINKHLQQTHITLSRRLTSEMQDGIHQAEQHLDSFAGDLMHQHLGTLKDELSSSLSDQLSHKLERHIKIAVQEELLGKHSYDRGHPLFDRVNQQIQGTISYQLSREVHSILARHEQQLIDRCRHEIAREASRTQTLAIAAIAVGLIAITLTLVL